MRLVRVLAAFFAATVGAAFAAYADDADLGGVGSEQRVVVAAEFYSSWCGPCHLLRPKVEALLPRYESDALKFVEFDFTWGKRQKHEELAAAFGVSEIYERYKRGQGYVVFVDQASGEVLDIVTGLDSKDKIEAAFERAARFIDDA